jgi:hypothetical protein
MPKRKKRADELTTEEAMKKLFPKEAREEAKKESEKGRSPAKLSIEKKSKE